MTKEQIEMIQRGTLDKTPLEIAADEDGFFECTTEECAFNNDGTCRYHAVYDKLPAMTEEDGCLCGMF